MTVGSTCAVASMNSWRAASLEPEDVFLQINLMYDVQVIFLLFLLIFYTKFLYIEVADEHFLYFVFIGYLTIY